MVRGRSLGIPYCPLDYKPLRVEEVKGKERRKEEEGKKTLTIRG